MCLFIEDCIMRISSIQNYQNIFCNAQKKKTSCNNKTSSAARTTLPAFKANETVKGIGLGAIVGLGALTVLSGGTAAPIAACIFAATSGAAGGLLGKAIEETNKDSKKNDNNEE